MARTTQTAVEGIISVSDGVDLDPFIAIANEMVTELCTNSSYSDDRLELIERWLSAHYYTNLAPRAVMEKADVVSETVQSKVDLGLNSSHYGQTAMQIDTAGNLAKHNKDTINGIDSSGFGFIALTTLTDSQEKAFTDYPLN